MTSIHIELSHCYGIYKLEHDFAFGGGKNVHLIYAPNGSMKSSLAKTLMYVSNQSKDKPCDLLHPDEANYASSYKVTLDGDILKPERIFVADGEKEFDSSRAFPNFLASKELKEKYDSIYTVLSEKKKTLISRLGVISKSSNCEEELVDTFKSTSRDTIFTVLAKLSEDVDDDLPSYEFKYNDVFDKAGKVKEFVDSNKDKLQTYFEQYEKLLDNSVVFRSHKGHKFGTYQASQVEKSVKDGSFFGVEHKIVLYGKEDDPIDSPEKFSDILISEKNRILNDEGLRNTFDQLSAIIDKNSDLRALKSIIDKHPDWIAELLDYETFKKKVWKGHLAKPELKTLLNDYSSVYMEKKAELDSVFEMAEKENESWKKIIEIYNDRFIVPFSISIENQRDIILRKEAAKLLFSYKETPEITIPTNRDDLTKKILSRGEKRAFNILQLIFELESRKLNREPSLIIMDDIADSFDYQNKYAIIEYIKDLAENSSDKFMLIVMTHNFDFYRTLHSRLNQKPKLWMSVRNDKGEICLEKGNYIKDVFTTSFINHDDSDKIFISMIPYVRNLIEYTKGDQDPGYTLLTECLHYKMNTENITEKQICDILKSYTHGAGLKKERGDTKVVNTIIQTAESIVAEVDPNQISLENKIALSMAIRIKAEKYLHDILLSAGKTEDEISCSTNQMGIWTQLYKNLLPNDGNRSIIERVNMMTPEMLHINSFMYEPLIDLSVSHLINLYVECRDNLRS